jgi:nicotinate phosphoribosyltransferase
MAEATGVTAAELGLLTDLYQLTMAQSYFDQQQNGPATFSLFVRKFPPHYGYLVAAGLATVVDYLARVHFPPPALEYLRQTGRFSEAFLAYLARWRFEGEVMALPEGRVFFVNEPILEVTAPLIQAQLVESFIVNAVHLQTLIATKAARCVQAAQGRSLIDFALRRTHGTDAAMKVARASYLAGFNATSNVLAGHVYGIPITGTMAHSYITSFPQEIEAFQAFAASYPDHTVLLIDTYDTLAGARRAVEVGREMARRGHRLLGVRLDSGDMITLSKQVRKILDGAGLQEVRIVASGGFDEYSIARAVAQEACIDAFGVGTKMGVAADAPYLDMAYKLVRYDGRPVMKLSANKRTLVEAKQLWRHTTDGQYTGDVISLRHECLQQHDVRPLLTPILQAGQPVAPLPSLTQARALHAQEMTLLPIVYRRHDAAEAYPVHLSAALSRRQQECENALLQQAL